VSCAQVAAARLQESQFELFGGHALQRWSHMAFCPRLARVCTSDARFVPPCRPRQQSAMGDEALTACSLPEKCSSATPRHVSSASGSAADTRCWVRACRRTSVCHVFEQCTADCYISGLGKRCALHRPLVAAPGAVKAGTGIVASALVRSSAACLLVHRPRPRSVSRWRHAAKLRPRQRPAAGWTCALVANWLAALAQEFRCADRGAQTDKWAFKCV